MYRIYPLEEITQELEDRYNEFLENGGLALHLDAHKRGTLPTREQWRQYLERVIDDLLNRSLRWAKPSSHAKQLLSELLPLYSPLEDKPRLHKVRRDKIDVNSDRLATDVLYPIELKVSRWINDALGDEVENLWRIWSVSKIGTDLVIERGMDYRVYAWERRLKGGEFEREETSHIHTE